MTGVKPFEELTTDADLILRAQLTVAQIHKKNTALTGQYNLLGRYGPRLLRN